jgi:FkbM family methyltransferase
MPSGHDIPIQSRISRLNWLSHLRHQVTAALKAPSPDQTGRTGIASVTNAGDLQDMGNSRPTIRLGEMCVIPIFCEGGSQSRVFVKHDAIFYLQPFADWAFRREIEFLPEAPGSYVVAVESRLPDGSARWNYSSVDVTTPSGTNPAPRLITADRDIRLWAPSEWESQLLAAHEQSTIGRLAEVVQPGAVIYDIGANLGLYSIVLSQLAGANAHLYCIEANPVCLYFLQLNLALNQVGSFEILPAAILDEQTVADFTVNYRNLLVGKTGELPYLGKPGHKIGVPTISLDEALAQYQLRPPDFIKIDIEGAEGAAVRGMRNTIDRYAPTILVELHGRGAAQETLGAVSWSGYRFQEASSGTYFENAADLSAWFPDACLQVIARRVG